MPLDFVEEFGNVELIAGTRRKLQAIVKVVEEVLVGIRTGGSIL